MFRRAPAAGLALAALLCGCAEPAPETPPNLLLVTIDTLRADRLACYGGPPDVGRYLCSLADTGTRFEWALSTAPYTAPSVASILTGRYPSFHGVTQTAVSYLRNEAVTLAELLKGAGYQTAAFVSNPVLDQNRNLGQGFDVYDQRMTRRERNRPGYVEREAQATTDAALAWAQVAAEPPWFLWVHYQDPHGPYEPPDPGPEYDDPGAERLPILPNHSGHRGIPDYQELPGLRTQGAYERRYLEEIRYLDPHLQRLVEGLDSLGDRPALLLTSDHGESFGEDEFYFSHGHSAGLDQIRVPLVWRPARPADPTVESEPVSLIDVAPTLLAAAGLEIPEMFQGQPLPAAGLRAHRDPPSAIFSEHARQIAVVAGRSYYARNHRKPPENRAEEVPAAGHRTVWLPARVATLPDGGGPLPAYEPTEPGAGASGELEPVVAEYLESAKGRSGPVHKKISPELRERLRALGYVD